MTMLFQRRVWRRRAEALAQQPAQNLPGIGLLIVRTERARDINGTKLLQKADQVAVLKFGAKDRPQQRQTKVHKNAGQNPVWQENSIFINTSQREEDIVLDIVLYSHYRWWGQKKVGEISLTAILRDLLRQQGSVSAKIPATSYAVLNEGKRAGDIIVGFFFIPMTVDNMADLGRLIPAPPGHGHAL